MLNVKNEHVCQTASPAMSISGALALAYIV